MGKISHGKCTFIYNYFSYVGTFSFYFTLFVVIVTDVLNIYMILLLTLKVFDLFYKLELIKTIFIKQNIPVNLSVMLDWKIPSWFFLMGVGLYPPLLFYALM